MRSPTCATRWACRCCWRCSAARFGWPVLPACAGRSCCLAWLPERPVLHAASRVFFERNLSHACCRLPSCLLVRQRPGPHRPCANCSRATRCWLLRRCCWCCPPYCPAGRSASACCPSTMPGRPRPRGQPARARIGRRRRRHRAAACGAPSGADLRRPGLPHAGLRRPLHAGTSRAAGWASDAGTAGALSESVRADPGLEKMKKILKANRFY